MTGMRNRAAGNNFEREIVTRYNAFGFTGREGEFSPLFPVLGTTRNLSTYMDSLKVDVMTVDPTALKEFGLLIQSKNTSSSAQYPKILASMQEAAAKFEGIPVIYHKQTERSGESARFMKRGEYAIMHTTDFEKIYTSLQTYKQVLAEIMTYFDSFPEEIQEELNHYLESRNM